MVCLWLWGLTYLPDGSCSDATPLEVEKGARWGGRRGFFYSTLVEQGWIDAGPPAKFHNWQHYSGKLEEKRRSDVLRKSAGRHPDIQRTSNGHPLDIQGRKEEKRVEEKRDPPTPQALAPSGLGPGNGTGPGAAPTVYRDKYRDSQARPWLRKGPVQTVGFDPAKTETHGEGGVTWTPEDVKAMPFRSGQEETERLRQAAKERLEQDGKETIP
jgi:hypothetical protein